MPGDKERVSKIWTQIYRTHGTPFISNAINASKMLPIKILQIQHILSGLEV